MPKTYNLHLIKKKLLKYGISIDWDFNHQLAHTDLIEILWKNHGNKIKESGEAYDIN